MAYTTPTAADLKARYPAFADVLDATVELWIAEAEDETITWPADVRARAVMAYAAHKLNEYGLGAGATPQGVNSFKSGTFSATLSDAQASRTGFAASVYGREYQMLQRRYFGGPRLAWTPPTNV